MFIVTTLISYRGLDIFRLRDSQQVAIRVPDALASDFRRTVFNLTQVGNGQYQGLMGEFRRCLQQANQPVTTAQEVGMCATVRDELASIDRRCVGLA